jgi:hypothetical protein
MAGSFEFDPVTETDLGADSVYTNINNTINVTFTPDAGSESETLISVTIIADINEDSISLNNGISSCSIQGNYTLDLFDKINIKYVDKGFSDKNQTPIIVDKISLVPENKEVFEVSSDPRQSILVTYTVTATTSAGVSESSTYTYTIGQTYDSIKNWIQDYFGGL